jgi:hypothetical protein
MITRCLTLISLALAASAAAAALPDGAAAARTGIYAGWLKSPGWDDAFVARTDRRGKRVKSVVVGLSMTCTDGSTYAFHSDLDVVKRGSNATGVLVPSRNRGGRFTAKYRRAGPIGAYDVQREVWASGKFKRRSARGSLRLTGVVSDPATNEPVATCDSTAYRWRAYRQRRRVYGGATGQGEPVVFRLNRARSNVIELGINWNSACADGGYIDVRSWFTDFGVGSGGKFGDIWGDTLKGTRYEYHLRGKIGRRRARGAFEVDAFPPTGTTCNSGLIRWRAKTG